MLKKGWSQSTFEVLTLNGERWFIDMTSSTKSEAMKRAESILSLGPTEGIRVTEMQDKWLKEKIVFEKLSKSNENILKIDPVSELSICCKINDYYALSSRLTIGRIMRKYLDQHGMTALELLFNIGHLRVLDRMDTYFPAAMQHVAKIQAQTSDESKTQRLDILYSVYDKIMKRAHRASDKHANFAVLLSRHGADRAISEVRAATPKNEKIVIYGMFAAHISGGTWAQKLGQMIDIADQATSPTSVDYADEIIAEILDGSEAIDEIFRGFSTSCDAWKTFIRLSSGRLENPPKYMSSEIARLNGLFLRYDFKATRHVLLTRISRGLKGTQALSNEGRDTDRKDFLTLLREMIKPTGLTGGPAMAEAVILRAKSLLGATSGDLTMETAIRQALYLMPSLASRLGMLLDLSASDLGHKHDSIIRQQLLQLLEGLRTIFDLFPDDVKQENHSLEIENLRTRLSQSPLPTRLKSVVSKSLITLAKGKSVNHKKPKPKPKRVTKGESDELYIQDGDVIFYEGETGNEAFLIIQGAVEIYRTKGHKQKQLAIVSAGEIIGEMALIDNQPRMASARAIKETVLVCISQNNLQNRLEQLAKQDTVLHLLLKTLVRRLRGLARNTE